MPYTALRCLVFSAAMLGSAADSLAVTTFDPYEGMPPPAKYVPGGQVYTQIQPLSAPAAQAPASPYSMYKPKPTAAQQAQVVVQPLAVAMPEPTPAYAVAPLPATPAPVSLMSPPVRMVPIQQSAPLVVPVAAPVAVTEPAPPAPKLANQTRQILGTIPSSLDTVRPATGPKVTIDRVSPEIKEVLGQESAEETYESVGLSIKVRRQGLDTDYELNRAYTALMGGDTQHAIDIYKDILSVEPKNEDAMFGLAATYHRLGLIEKARPFYGMLLKQNPGHRDALNNFLTMVADESPEDALPELQRLEERNPDFSPIPAQIAVVLDKMGHAEQAEDKLLRAIDIAPENLTYKYNLAVMLDRHGRYADASALYRALITAGLRGEPIPAPLSDLQKRLNYIVTAQTEARAGG